MTYSFKLAKFRFNAFATNRRDFYEDFAISLRDGASIIDQLKVMSIRSRKRKTGWAPLYEHWIQKMRRMSFGHALQHTVPPYEAMVLTAAEEDGRVAEAMDYLGRSIRLLGKVRSIYFVSLISPIIAIIVILGFLVTFAILIAPEYLQIIPLNRWPILTQMIYHTSVGLINNAVAISLFAIVAVILVEWSKSHWHGYVRAKFDKIPLTPWASHRHNESNNFLIALSILLQSNNHGIKEGLEMMRRFSSPWLSWHITVMLHRLKLTPGRPALALDSGLFDSTVMDRIEDYAERTEFNNAIYKLAFDSGEKFVEQAQGRALVISLIAMFAVAAMSICIAISNLQFSQAVEAGIKSL